MIETIGMSQTSKLKQALSQRGADVSAIGLRDLKRYYALLSYYRPHVTFTIDEAILLCEGLQNHPDEEAIAQSETLLYDAIQNHSNSADPNLHQKWLHHGKSLLEKLQTLNTIQAVALIDVVEQFWVKRRDNPQLSFQETLHQCDLIQCCEFAL